MGLKFIKVGVYEIKIPFRVSYRHALADRREASSLIIEVTTEDGIVGYGEVVPRSYLTGETLESAKNFILNQLWDKVSSLDISKLAG